MATFLQHLLKAVNGMVGEAKDRHLRLPYCITATDRGGTRLLCSMELHDDTGNGIVDPPLDAEAEMPVVFTLKDCNGVTVTRRLVAKSDDPSIR